MGASQSIRCVAPRADGHRCTKWAVRGGMKCFLHGLTQAQRVELARSGGRARAKSERRYKYCPSCGYDLAK
jgi:hypothetical protein